MSSGCSFGKEVAMSNRVQNVLCWCLNFLLAGALCFVVALAGAYGKNLDGRYDKAPNKKWYESQVNKKGEWCCNEADGHPYYGDYKLTEDGRVVFDFQGQHVEIPKDRVLNGPNPTGHAVWWYTDGASGRFDWCFATGSLG
jgi:hypothetical protein